MSIWAWINCTIFVVMVMGVVFAAVKIRHNKRMLADEQKVLDGLWRAAREAKTASELAHAVSMVDLILQADPQPASVRESQVLLSYIKGRIEAHAAYLRDYD